MWLDNPVSVLEINQWAAFSACRSFMQACSLYNYIDKENLSETPCRCLCVRLTSSLGLTLYGNLAVLMKTESEFLIDARQKNQKPSTCTPSFSGSWRNDTLLPVRRRCLRILFFSCLERTSGAQWLTSTTHTNSGVKMWSYFTEC